MAADRPKNVSVSEVMPENTARASKTEKNNEPRFLRIKYRTSRVAPTKEVKNVISMEPLPADIGGNVGRLREAAIVRAKTAANTAVSAA
jgi:hypothetical protein